jgi:YfiH family protein
MGGAGAPATEREQLSSDTNTHEQHRDRLPAPGAGFVWDESHHGVGPYPVLRPVLDRVDAVYTTRLGGVSESPFDQLNVSTTVGDGLHRVLANRDLAARPIGRGPWWSTVKQVHGSDVVVAHPVARGAGGRHREADAQWTEDDEATLAVLSADCVLVLAAGATRLGVAHAGWRGIVAGVIENIVRETEAEHVFLGPAIGPCCFEVGAEVAGAFTKRYPEAVTDQRHVDLWTAAEEAARTGGASDVRASRLCTSCEAGLFFSHRRDRGSTGRQALLARLGAPGAGR